MKQAACVIASILCLGACNKSPSVDLHNATGNQVDQAVQKSGVMSGGDTMVEPGLWQSKVTIKEMTMPGLPAQYANQMKQRMAEHQEQTSEHCLTPEEAKKPKEGFFHNDKSCHFAHFAMGGGKIDMQMVCNEEGSQQTMNMSGTYSRTSYSMDMSSNGTGEGGMTMKMHVDSNRVGECTGKE